MKIKSTLYLLILQTLIFTGSVYSESITLGGEDNWNGAVLNNLKTVPGKGGFLDLVLRRTELSGTEGRTDLLLPLNQNEQRDQTGRYLIQSEPEYSDRYFRSGSGSATFNRENQLILKAEKSGSLFSPFSNWEDFTIEFWLYPANPREGEKILQWKGLGRNSEGIYTQSILCHFINRRLVWSFSNIFQLPDNTESLYEISGDPVLPRQWNHHLLRYDSKTGLLEYLINGTPSAVIYTTDTGSESSIVYSPRIGEKPGEIIIGAGFTGFMDEFRIERVFNEEQSTGRYNLPGYGISRVIDLEYSDSQLNKVNSVVSNPGDSAVFPYYFITNHLLEAERAVKSFRGEDSILTDESVWKSSTQIEGKGRYLVISFLLYPDMKTDETPGLSFLEIDYTPALPPLPPTYLHAGRDETGRFKVEWNSSASPDVEGYLLYFGDKPGEYIYPGSPLKIEKENYIYIDGLSAFKQYFFAVKSYSGKETPRYSDFSYEISVRP